MRKLIRDGRLVHGGARDKGLVGITLLWSAEHSRVGGAGVYPATREDSAVISAVLCSMKSDQGKAKCHASHMPCCAES